MGIIILKKTKMKFLIILKIINQSEKDCLSWSIYICFIISLFSFFFIVNQERKKEIAIDLY